nr:contact-dependent growth inhibition system immunity protein [Neisseria elongata]
MQREVTQEFGKNAAQTTAAVSDKLGNTRSYERYTDNETLGTTVLQALANSRTFVYDSLEDQDFFDTEKFRQRYEDWVANLCGNLGYKTRRALFKNMMSGDIWLHNGCLKISPSRHVKLEAWDAIDADDVILSLDNSPEKIGSGLRLALSRCR